jgi:hypothetical protein
VEIHAHVVAGRSNGSTVGGHIMEAYVRPTLEVMLSESPSHLQRKVDQNSGLALISIKICLKEPSLLTSILIQHRGGPIISNEEELKHSLVNSVRRERSRRLP